MNPCAFPTRDVSSLSCLPCPFARCLPSLLWLPGSVLVGSEAHVVGVVSVEQFVVQVEAGVQFVVQLGVVVVPPLLLLALLPFVLPPLLLEACKAGPCRRKGTRKAPIPATIRAIAPTLRFADVSIVVFPFSFFLELNPGLRGPGI